MTSEEVVNVIVWAVTSTCAVIASFVWGQVEGTDATTVLLGAAGLTGLVALLYRLASDYRNSSKLIDQYQESLKDERAENQILRDQIRQHRGDPT